MGLFGRKPKAPWKEIHDAAWGHLVSAHGITVDELSKEYRAVEREGVVDGLKATLLRVFKPKEAEQKGVTIAGWETFDQHPDLVHFEGHMTWKSAKLERRKN